MISYINGSVEEILSDSIILDHQGMGFQIFMPTGDLGRLERGRQLRIYTYFQVREDAFAFYGFLKKDELELFRLLIGVNGVGPKAAITILSTLTTDDLRFAIAGGDVKLLSKAQGVGQKTAQRIILDLKDKMDLTSMLEPANNDPVSEGNIDPAGNQGNQERKDAILALESLGYSSTEILKAMSDFPADTKMDTESWIREILKKIGLKI